VAGDFVDELLAFPQGAHDDQVDVLAYAAAAAVRSPSVVDSLDLHYSESLSAAVWRLIESPDKNLLAQPW
jgi:hypothetical protein